MNDDVGSHPARPLRRLPTVVWIVAVLAALLHLAPYVRAELQAPPGWTFTANLRVSPDFMQYRVWMRQSQVDGPLVTNTLTAEPNPPHLPVVFYWAVGTLARLTGQAPEWTLAFVGAALAFVLVVLLFVIVSRFFSQRSHAYWVFAAMLLGGGFGGHLKLARRLVQGPGGFDRARPSFLEPGPCWILSDDHRGHYLVATLFDAHFLFVWCAALLAVLAFHSALRQDSVARLSVAAALFGAVTFFHPYSGITLGAIAGGVALLCWVKGVSVQSALRNTLTCIAAVVLVCAGLWLLYRSSGLPMPTWRALNIPVAILFAAYPLAWVVGIAGLPGYWRRAGLDECFVLGWALGCTALSLSGPFYPYPDRGALTLVVPIWIVAGAVYFTSFRVVTPVAAVVAFLVMAATPAWALHVMWASSGFAANRPYAFISDEHRRIIDALRARATRDDILLTETPDVAWIAPEYAGRLYCGHFFLTVDYQRKCTGVARLFESPTAEQAAFLEGTKARFVYVDRSHDQASIERLGQLSLIERTSVGALYERSSKRAQPREGTPGR